VELVVTVALSCARRDEGDEDLLVHFMFIRRGIGLGSLQEKLPWPTKLKSRRGCWCTMADDFGSLRGACQNFFFLVFEAT
jgi:hypothetical protein